MGRGPNYPWESILKRLRAQPGKWILHPTMIGRPISIVDAVHMRRAAALRITDGRIATHIANKSINEEGKEIVDLYLRFIPKEGP